MNDRDLLKQIKEDVGRQRYHIACNRVFDWAHKGEIKYAKEHLGWGVQELDTIVHPNTYFKRSYLLRNGVKATEGVGSGEEMRHGTEPGKGGDDAMEM